MFPGYIRPSGLSLAKIISGISKTLGVVNKALPIYQQIKPTIGKVSDFIGKYNTTNKKSTTKQVVSTPIKSERKLSVKTNSLPTFFN